MSVNVSIKEGGEGKVGTVDQLETPKQGGGTEIWYPKSAVQLGTKSVTQNGTYTAASDGKYGFSQFTVNVRGGNGSADSHGKPNTSSGAPEPGGAGSAVIGTDPTTGNDAVVGVDSNGNLVTTPVPSGIKIVTLPTKTSYVYQEAMDYTGIVVSAIKKDGTTFTDARYTNGHIPMSELIFPVDKAPAASGRGYTISTPMPLVEEYFDYPIYANSHYTASGTKTVNYYFSSGTGLFIPFEQPKGRSRNLIAISQDANAEFTSVVVGGSSFTNSVVGPYQTLISKEPYYYQIVVDLGGDWLFPYNRLKKHLSSLGGINDQLATVIFDGTLEGGTVSIPVKWNNPYTGNVHQDTFEIASTGSNSTNTNNDEGGGGGHSF